MEEMRICLFPLRSLCGQVLPGYFGRVLEEDRWQQWLTGVSVTLGVVQARPCSSPLRHFSKAPAPLGGHVSPGTGELFPRCFFRCPPWCLGPAFSLLKPRATLLSFHGAGSWCSQCRVTCCQRGISFLHWLLLWAQLTQQEGGKP